MKTKVALSEQELRSLIRDVLIEAPVPEGAGDDFDSLVTPETKAHLDKMISYLGKFIVPQGDAGSQRFRSRLSLYIMNSPPQLCQSPNTEMEGGAKFISYSVAQASSTDAGPDALLINLFNFIACAFALGKSVSVHTSRGERELEPACSLYSISIGDKAYVGTMDPERAKLYTNLGITVFDLKTDAGQQSYIQEVITKTDVLQKVTLGLKQVEGAANRKLAMLDYYDDQAKEKAGSLLQQQIKQVNDKIKEYLNTFNTAQLQYYLYEPLVRPTQWISNPDLEDPASSPWWTTWEACNIFARTINAAKDGPSQNAACAAMVLLAAKQAKTGVAFRASDKGWSSELQGGTYQGLLESKSGKNLRVFLTEAQLKRLIYAALALNEVDTAKVIGGAQKALAAAGDAGVPGAGLAAKALGAATGDAEPVAAAVGAVARSAPEITDVAASLRSGGQLDNVEIPQAAARIIKAAVKEADQAAFIKAIARVTSDATIEAISKSTATISSMADKIAEAVSNPIVAQARARGFAQDKLDLIDQYCRAAAKYAVEAPYGKTDSKSALDAARTSLIEGDESGAISAFLDDSNMFETVLRTVSEKIILTSRSISDTVESIDPSISSGIKGVLDGEILPMLRDRGLGLEDTGDIVFRHAGYRYTEKPATLLANLTRYRDVLSSGKPIDATDTAAKNGRAFILAVTGRDDASTVNEYIELLTSISGYAVESPRVGPEMTRSAIRILVQQTIEATVNYVKRAVSEVESRAIDKKLASEPGTSVAERFKDFASAAIGGSTAATSSYRELGKTAEDILNSWQRGAGGKASAIWKTASLLLFSAPKLRADIGRGAFKLAGATLTLLGSKEWGPAISAAGGFKKYIGPRILGDIIVFTLVWPYAIEPLLKNDPVAKTLFADILVRGGWTEFGGVARLAVDAANEIGRDIIDQDVQAYMSLVAKGNAPSIMRALFQNLMANQLANVSDADLVQIFRLAGPDTSLQKFGPIAEFLAKRVSSLGGEFGDVLKSITPEMPDVAQEDVSAVLIDATQIAKETEQLKAELSKYGSDVAGNSTLTTLKQGRVAVISQVLRLLDNMAPTDISINPVNASSAVSSIETYEKVLTADYRRDLEASPTAEIFGWFDNIDPDNLWYLPVFIKNAAYPVETDDRVSTASDPTTLTNLGAGALYNGPGRKQDVGEIEELDKGLIQDVGRIVEIMSNTFKDVYIINQAIQPAAVPAGEGSAAPSPG